MFCGFVKSIPIEIEEAAMIDGCSPIRTFFSVVLPIMKPTYISAVSYTHLDVYKRQVDSLRFYQLGNHYQNKVEHIGVHPAFHQDDVLIF